MTPVGKDRRADPKGPALLPLLSDDRPLGGSGQAVERILALAREHLGLEVAWLSRFTGGDQILEAVEGDTTFGISPGFSSAYDQSYCARVLTGELPSIVADARNDERTKDLAITDQLGIGAYVGVPVVLPGGEVYGMMCCLSHDARTQLDARDLAFVRLLAEVLSDQVQRRRPPEEERRRTIARVEGAINGQGLRIVFQPIVRLDSLEVVGVEALSRFDGGPPTPDLWFREAALLGLGPALELASLRLALAAIPGLPEHVYVAINGSPESISRFANLELPDHVPYHRLVVEITEHAPIADYDLLQSGLAPLRSRGVRVAIDDAGAGYSSFRHILSVRPDLIKLDISITRSIDSDPSRRALATAFVSFAAEIGATLVAEGVETPAEVEALRLLGVDTAQGYLFARPGILPLPEHIRPAGVRPLVAAQS